MKTRLLLLSMICSFAPVANAAPPVVTGVSASQRAGTKIVDITYNVTMDAGETAFVELSVQSGQRIKFSGSMPDLLLVIDANVSAGTGTRMGTPNPTGINNSPPTVKFGLSLPMGINLPGLPAPEKGRKYRSVRWASGCIDENGLFRFIN